MFEYLLITSLNFGFMEIIHVELADKWWKVVVFEVLRKNPITELLRLLDDESITISGPGDYVLSCKIVDNLEEFDEEGRNVVYRLVLVIELDVRIRCVPLVHGRLIVAFGWGVAVGWLLIKWLLLLLRKWRMNLML